MREAQASKPDLSFKELVDIKVKAFGSGDLSWIYQLDIKEVWEQFLET